MLNVVPQGYSYSYFVVGIIALVVLAAIAVFVLQWWPGPFGAQGPLNDALQSGWSTAPMAATPGAAITTIPEQTLTSQKSQKSQKSQQKESWCFVGEDLTGRYCVQVPSEKSCDADRVFGNRKDCELTPANHMASGIVQENGESMLPLAKMRFG